MWGSVGCTTYLPLGGMTVEAGLGGAVTSALPVVDVGVELEVDHFSGKLDESARVAIHRARGGGERDEGRTGEVSLGMG